MAIFSPMTQSEIVLIGELVNAGHSSREIAKFLGRSKTGVQKHINAAANPEPTPVVDDSQPAVDPLTDTLLGTVGAADIARISSLEDLIAFFKVDLDRWDITSFKVNKWEQASRDKARNRIDVTPLYQVYACMRPKLITQESLSAVWADMIADIAEHAPSYHPPQSIYSLSGTEPVLFQLSLKDPHFGMLAWYKEVGSSYDTDIAQRDYTKAVDFLLAHAPLYPVERVLYMVGDDGMHVDGPSGAGSKGGATTAGTPQDIDSRLARIFTAYARSVISGIERSMTLGHPVDVMVVPGNHDRLSTYKLAEVLNAWFRNTDMVNIIYSPNVRKYYNYGNNTFMFTHGEEYNRTRREQLPLIFATECPAELWVKGAYREIHTGHNHARKQGQYVPTSAIEESRSIITRSLPALTATDSWHHEMGYSHRRAATLLTFRRDGGMAGHHEFTL